MRYHFIIVDVFTDTQFGGNQLAVLTDARGLTAEGMQAITREFDYPETTFVLPAADPANTNRVRIFTPGRELEFAGHPTIGTACALVMSGKQAAGEIKLEEGVGPVSVSVARRSDAFAGRLRIDGPPEIRHEMTSREQMAEVLSLPDDDVVRVFCSGVGVNFTFVEVRSRGAVDESQLDLHCWKRILADKWGAQVFVFAGDLRDGGEIYARMYAPGFGILEDPATGSAAAAIIGAAAMSMGSDTDGTLTLNIVQGVAMGRPSSLIAVACLKAGKLNFIEVEGGCCFVAEGQMEVPSRYLE